jgi:hypothetical protein
MNTNTSNIPSTRAETTSPIVDEQPKKTPLMDLHGFPIIDQSLGPPFTIPPSDFIYPNPVYPYIAIPGGELPCDQADAIWEGPNQEITRIKTSDVEHVESDRMHADIPFIVTLKRNTLTHGLERWTPICLFERDHPHIKYLVTYRRHELGS